MRRGKREESTGLNTLQQSGADLCRGIVSCPFKQKRGVPVETALPQRRTM